MTTATPLIERARPEDAAAIAKLLNSAYRGEGSKVGWTTEADLVGGVRATPEIVANLIHENGSHFLLARNQASGELLGCVHLREEGEATLYFGMLAVRPDLQAKGLGKQLINGVEAHARRAGLSKVRMTVINFRPELIAYYQRMGYRPTGKQEAFPNKSDVLVEGIVLLEFAKVLA